MPTALILPSDDGPVRVPLVGDPLRIGREPGCDVVVDRAGVLPVHAVLRWPQGEPVLTATDGATLRLAGGAWPFLVVRPGDEIALGDGPDAPALRFEDRLEGAFVPPGRSPTEAWLAHPASRRPEHGPERWGAGRALPGRRAGRGRVVPGGARGGRLVVKRLGPVATAAAGDAWLRLLVALAGAAHPGVGRVVDGGVAPGPRGPERWLAVAWVDGRCLRDALTEDGPPAPAAALAWVADLAEAVAHLHRRGVVHGDVAPGNVILRASGPPALVDLGHVAALGAPRAPEAGVVGTPGYLAPERVLGTADRHAAAQDVWALGALAWTLLVGAPPGGGEDALDRLAAATRPPPPLASLGVDVVPRAAETIGAALDPDPAARPSAVRLAGALRAPAGDMAGRA